MLIYSKLAKATATDFSFNIAIKQEPCRKLNPGYSAILSGTLPIVVSRLCTVDPVEWGMTAKTWPRFSFQTGEYCSITVTLLGNMTRFA
jgi:hypothetical protein